MWLKFLNSKWFDRLFTSVFAILVVLLTQGLIGWREGKSSISNELDLRPTIEMVNSQFAQERVYIDQQDANIKSTLQQHIEESNRSNETMMSYIKSIDANVRVLLGK